MWATKCSAYSCFVNYHRKQPCLSKKSWSLRIIIWKRSFESSACLWENLKTVTCAAQSAYPRCMMCITFQIFTQHFPDPSFDQAHPFVWCVILARGSPTFSVKTEFGGPHLPFPLVHWSSHCFAWCVNQLSSGFVFWLFTVAFVWCWWS